jgi:hypothetical protein
MERTEKDHTLFQVSYFIVHFTLNSSSVSQSLSFNLLQSFYCPLSSVLALCLQISGTNRVVKQLDQRVVWFLLRHMETDELRYYHSSQNNSKFFYVPQLIRTKEDLLRFLDEMQGQERSDEPPL